MVEIFGKVKSSVIKDGSLVVEFLIPAFSERLARRRAMFNANSKDLQEPEITNLEVTDTSAIPGQKIFTVTIQSER